MGCDVKFRVITSLLTVLAIPDRTDQIKHASKALTNNFLFSGIWWQHRWLLSVQELQSQLDARSSMHFWIDKRSQTCGFSGRHRVPASLSAAGCGQHQRRQRRRSRAKPMVTPVHRFQPIECVAGAGGGGGGGGFGSQHGARRSQHHHQQLQHHHNRQLRNCFPSAYRFSKVQNFLRSLS